MSETTSRERTGVLAALSLLLAAACITLLREEVHLVVSPWAFGALLVPVVVFAALLRARRDTWGREGRYVDAWSIPHFLVGVLGFFAGIELVAVVVIATAWELIELAARVREYPTNRAIDLGLATAGWLCTQAVMT